MPRLLLVAALLVGALGLTATTASASPAPRHSLHVGQALRHGQALTSANGKYRASIRHGRLVVTNRAWHRLWASPRAGRGAVLRIGKWGQLKLMVGRRNAWTAGTARSGMHAVLTMRNNGVLALRAAGGSVWTDALRDRCPSARGKRFVVDLSRQLARACRDGQQIRVTRVTTGAVALGDGTPGGRWHVQAKIRDTVLYPAAGGAYPVKYWVPYDGAYGLHDSPWQKFPYGSPKYRRHGSHGCVHVPGHTMAWLYGWLRIGTTVAIHK